MKIENQDNWEVSGLKSQQIGVDPEAIGKLIGLLSRRMYSFPHSAFREAWLNARESHAKRALRDFPEDTTQGQAVTRPMEISLPIVSRYGAEIKDQNLGYRVVPASATGGASSLNFSIRDYGVGLSASELEELITNAGKSDKTGDNTYGGGMGIGSLAGFSVADQIVYTAFKDGLKSSLVLSSESNAFVASEAVPTDEEDGVRLSYVIRDEATAEAFVQGAAEFLAMAPEDERAIIVCDQATAATLSDRKGLTFPRGSKGLHLLSCQPNVGSSDSLNIRIDGCFYRGEHKGLVEKIREAVNKHTTGLHPNFTMDSYSHHANSLFRNIIWDVSPGYFQGISPNRETISLSKAEVDTFVSLYLDYMKDYFALAVEGETLLTTLRSGNLDAGEELSKLREVDALRKHPAFASVRTYNSSPDVNAVYASNFTADTGAKVIGARANGLPYGGGLIGHSPRGDKFHLAPYNHRGVVRVSTRTAYHLPGGVIGRAHTVRIDGTTYAVNSETYRGAEKIINLSPYEVSEGKTLLRVVSSSNQLNQDEWTRRIEALADANLGKLSAEEKALVKKVTDSDAEVIVSVPASKEIEAVFGQFGLNVEQVGETVDGVALRKVYSKLFASKRKTDSTKYSVLLSDAAKALVGAGMYQATADTLNESGLTLVHSPIKVGGRWSDLNSNVLLAAVAAQHKGPVALVSRRGEQQSEDKMIAAVNFQGKVDDLSDKAVLSAVNPTAREIMSHLDMDSAVNLVASNAAIAIGIDTLPEFSALVKVTKKMSGEPLSRQRRWTRQSEVSAVLNRVSKESVEKIAKETIGITTEEAKVINNLAVSVTGAVNINNIHNVVSREVALSMVKTVLSSVSA